jgi:hypothetical protein
MNRRKLRIFVVACGFMIDLSRTDRMQLTREERRDTITWVPNVPHRFWSGDA